MISVVTPCRTLLSALGLIGKTKSEWVLMSIKPGVMARPSASMTRLAYLARHGPSAAMRPALMAMSPMLPGAALPSINLPWRIRISHAIPASVGAPLPVTVWHNISRSLGWVDENIAALGMRGSKVALASLSRQHCHTGSADHLP